MFATIQGKTVLFVTNNSMKSRQAYLTKFERLGVPADLVSGCVAGGMNERAHACSTCHAA